ncbi:TIGR04438 family Trp-rich protein [Hydrogenophaga aquatica]
MYLLVLGVALLILKYLEVDPVSSWEWWWVLSPFAMAVVWWWWADFSGYTRRKAMAREDQRKEERINTGRKRLGLPPIKRK